MATTIPDNQARIDLGAIAWATGGRLSGGQPEQTVVGVTIDSRRVRPGCLFVAIRGERLDGARYVEDAARSGAACLLVPRGTVCPDGVAVVEVADTTEALGKLAAHYRSDWPGEVVAITGSAGKTTTKELTAAAFGALGARVLKTEGNLNNQFGVPMMLFMLDERFDTAVLEVGTSGPGEIAALGKMVDPRVAAVLLAAPAHTEGLGNVLAVADEKASLWDCLTADGVAVVNADDGNLMARVARASKTLSFGAENPADVRLVACKLHEGGTRVRFEADGQSLEARLPLLGKAAAVDAAAALAIVWASRGAKALARACMGLEQVAQVPGRMVPREGRSCAWVLDDTYNSNPGSARTALETLTELARGQGGRAVAVLGDMKELGEISTREHARLGEAAVELGVDLLVGVGPEMVQGTAAAVSAASGRFAPHPTQVVHVKQVGDVVPVLKLEAGDIVLVKGSRSMRMERVVEQLVGGPR